MRRLWFLTGVVIVASLLAGIAPAHAAPTPKPVTYYVNDDATGADNGKSWQDAFTDLQSALDEAVAGDEIWVAAGTYRPSLSIDGSSSTDTRTASFSLKGRVALYGGFAGDEKQLDKRNLDPALTILSGDIGTAGDDTDNCYHVVYASGVTDAVLDGFTVTAGRADRVTGDGSLRVRDTQGAGMYNYNSAPTITNCTFTSNHAGGDYGSLSYGQGGGMYNYGTYGSYPDETWPRITGCTFTDNTAYSAHYDPENGGGGMYNGAGAQTVESCTFTGNSAGNGGAMVNYMSTPILSNCLFAANFTTSSEGMGGAIFNLGNPTMLNCTFYKNGWRLMPEGFPEPRFRPYTTDGGAIAHYAGGSTIKNCIFSGNAVRSLGGAIVYGRLVKGATLTNCLLYENISWHANSGADPVSNHVYGTPRLFTESDNLFDVDPLLVDPAAGDFHLQYDSPGIEAGDRTTLQDRYSWPALPATDFYGNKRIVDGDADGTPTVDIGAAEYLPDLPGLRAFLRALADAGDIDETLVTSLLAYVDAAEAALDQGDEETAIGSLNELIADANTSLGEIETAQLIERKTLAVIEEL